MFTHAMEYLGLKKKSSPPLPLSSALPRSSSPLFSSWLPDEVSNSSVTITSVVSPAGNNANDESSMDVVMTTDKRCNIIMGEWVRKPEAPYYTKTTCLATSDRQNCMKHREARHGLLEVVESQRLLPAHLQRRPLPRACERRGWTKVNEEQRNKVGGFGYGTTLLGSRNLRWLKRKEKRFALQTACHYKSLLMRPDGHPGPYGHPRAENYPYHDCSHWCLPGPIYAWNDFCYI